ncbi:monocarboxylate transporter 2-like [Anneissia japonica]|uniref:monocarboxylate transporter 2-like n=1 Tax=Anneissia japonica TaxID=1529436 RepID=UPI001425692E|nr:monocarboxylate transporter 2-like [Anneissia japonica]
MNCSEGFVSFWGAIQLAVLTGIGPTGSALLRRFGMRRLGGVAGFVSCCVLLFLSIGARNKWMFVIAVCLQGLCLGTIYTATFVVAAKTFTTRLSQVNAVLLVTSVVPAGLAPLIQKLVDNYGWRGAIAIVAAAHLHVTVASFLLNPRVGKVELDLEDIEDDYQTDLENHFKNINGFFKKTLKRLHLEVFSNNRQLLALCLSVIIGGLTMTSFWLFFVPYAVDSGISPIDASEILLASVISCVLIRLFLFLFGDIDVTLIIKISAVAQLFELTSFSIFAIGHNFLIFYISSAFHGFAFGMLWHGYVTLATKFVRKTNEIDDAISWILLAEGVGSISSAIVGFSVNSYRLGFQICCGVQLIAVVLVVYILILQKRKPNNI